MIAHLASSLTSIFSSSAAPPPPSAPPSPPSASSVSHADRVAALAATRRDVGDRLAARRADRAKEDLADVAAADAAILRAEREALEARARCATSISSYFYDVGAPLVAAVRALGTREESEAFRRHVLEVDGRCRAELGEPMRYALIGYLLAAERRPHAIEGAAAASAPGARASAVLDAAAMPGRFDDALRDLERAIEAALPESDLERFEALRGCSVGSEEVRISAAILKRRNGALA